MIILMEGFANCDRSESMRQNNFFGDGGDGGEATMTAVTLGDASGGCGLIEWNAS